MKRKTEQLSKKSKGCILSIIKVALKSWCFASLCTLSACQSKEPAAFDPDPARYVNPFIGAGGHGHTFPGTTLPFGMAQLSPDTRLEGWDGCSGYHYTDTILYGFSHTHLSGTGIPDYCDILLMPTTGPVRLNNGADGRPGYRSAFDKTSEEASLPSSPFGIPTGRPILFIPSLNRSGPRISSTAS